jgi:hypothetical protein
VLLYDHRVPGSKSSGAVANVVMICSAVVGRDMARCT